MFQVQSDSEKLKGKKSVKSEQRELKFCYDKTKH